MRGVPGCRIEGGRIGVGAEGEGSAGVGEAQHPEMDAGGAVIHALEMHPAAVARRVVQTDQPIVVAVRQVARESHIPGPVAD